MLIIFIGSGGRRRILENGNLIIDPVARDDDGIYICIAQNIHGTEESQGKLIIMRKYTKLNIIFYFNLFVFKTAIKYILNIFKYF